MYVNKIFIGLFVFLYTHIEMIEIYRYIGFQASPWSIQHLEITKGYRATKLFELLWRDLPVPI